MFRFLRLLRASIGRKLLMALSGLVLVAFVSGHMIGNLKVFQGAVALNDYAAWLQGNPLLWGIRLFMLAIIVAHIAAALWLVLGNRAARPQRYVLQVSQYTGIAARSMAVSGVLVLLFLVFHLLHLTIGVVQPEIAAVLDQTGRPDVYHRVVAGFETPWIALVYMLSVALVGLHLQHAVASLIRTLGFSNANFHRTIDYGGSLLALLVTVGFLSIPLAVQFGVLSVNGS